MNLDNGNTENEIYFDVYMFYTLGEKTIKDSFDAAQCSLDSIEMQDNTFEGWTVIEYGSAIPVYFPAGSECNVGDPDQIMVYGGRYGAKDLWLGLCDYKEYPNKMSTEEIMKLDGTKNYYFMANWKEASEDVKISLGEEASDLVRKEVAKLVDAITSGQVTSEMRNLYSAELIDAITDVIQAGNEITTEIQAYIVEEEYVDATAAGEIKNYLGEKGKLVQYLDLSIVVKSISAEGIEKELGTLKGLEKEITFTIEIPEKLMQDGRSFFILRNHEGSVDKLNLNKNADGTYSFKTDRFSTYALAYNDVESGTVEDVTKEDITKEEIINEEESKGENKVPATGDDSYILLCGVLMTLALAATFFARKRVFE